MSKFALPPAKVEAPVVAVPSDLNKFDISFANGPDLQTKIGPTYRLSGVPETYVLDQQGNVRFTKISPVSTAELAAWFEQLLKE